MNCLALEARGKLLLVDCGAMFTDRERGVDVVLPDLSWLLARRRDLLAVVLTHGHEDHVGALPALLREAPVPVWGPRYALEVARERVRRVASEEEAPLRELPTGSPVPIGPFTVTAAAVAHSIVDARALLIETPAGLLVHSGDFQLDDGFDPRFGHFDAEAFAHAGERGVRLLLSDSTNALVERPAARERDVRATLGRLVAEASARVVLALFASNVQRLQAAIDAGLEAGRKVCLLGRAMQRHADIATRLGLLKVPPEAWVAPGRLGSVPPERLLVLATGTQGEPAAALARLAARRHPDLALEAGDRVILSSRIIPGHERRVIEMVDAFERAGVEVVHRGIEPLVHASGHATATEQRRLLRLVRPRAFLPVHGGAQQLRVHADLARAEGVDDVLVAYDGQVVELRPEGPLRRVGEVPIGRIHLHAGEALPEEVLSERGRLGADGFALVVLNVDAAGFPTGPARVLTRGVTDEQRHAELLGSAAAYVDDEVEAFVRPLAAVPADGLEEVARRALARFLRRRLGRRPLTGALLMPTDVEEEFQ